jgi:hypothetical protein
MPSPRSYEAEQRRRNARARADGWTSYAQSRRWLPRFEADQRGTAEYLAARLQRVPYDPNRPNSYFNSAVNRRINPNIASDEAGAPRKGDWRARLVNAARSG